MLEAWCASSGYVSARGAALADGYGLILSDPLDEQERGWMDVAIKADAAQRSAFRETLASEDLTKFDAMRERMVGDLQKLEAYEAFAGFTFLNWSQIESDAFGYVPRFVSSGRIPVSVMVPYSQLIYENRNAVPSSQAGYVRLTVPVPLDGIAHLDSLWSRLVDDASNNLMGVLRLARYVDMVDLVISDTGISFDFTALDNAIAAKTGGNPHEGAALFLDLYHTHGDAFNGIGWVGAEQLRQLGQQALTNADIRSAFEVTEFGFFTGADGHGTPLADVLAGDALANVFDAGLGDDVLDGQAGDDRLYGGSGNDTLHGGSGQDQLQGGDGDDALFGDDGADDLQGNAGNDLLDAGADDDTLHGGSGNDVMTGGDGHDSLFGGIGADTLMGGAGQDTVAGGWGDDVVSGEAGHDLLDGSVGSDRLMGGDGNDTLLGAEGNDTLIGGAGADSLQGGADDDTYVWGRGDGMDAVMEGVASAGDRVVLTGVAADDLLIRAQGQDLIINVKDTGEKLNVRVWMWAFDPRFSRYDVENFVLDDGTVWDRAGIMARMLIGTPAGDTLTGYDSADLLVGYVGNDSLLGGAGDDTLDGGGDSDELLGDTGSDLLLGGEGYDRLFGGDGNDTLDGGTQDDELNGGLGNDTYIWGPCAGNDWVYDLGQAGDLNTIDLHGLIERDVSIATTTRLGLYGGQMVTTITEHDTGETLTILFNADDQMSGTRFVFADGGIWDADQVRSLGLFGTEGDDVLTGNALNQALEGGNGNDTLDGGAGNDFISGLDGDDVYLWGRGAGNDVAYEDWWVGGDDVVRLTNLYAVDVRMVRVDRTVTLTDRLTGETMTLLDAYSGGGPPLIERIEFADGSTLALSAISEVVNHAPEAGTPVTPPPLWAGVPFSLTLGAEVFTDMDEGDSMTLSATLTSGQALPAWLTFDSQTRQFSGTPGLQDGGVADLRLSATDLQGASASVVFALTVNTYHVLTGTAVKDTITGTDAMERIDGLAGADRMTGGRNDDTYVVDLAKDVVIELAGEGWDRIESTVNYTLPDHVEGLVLLGTANRQGTGNALANELVGNTGNNRLDGMAGADTLIGGEGNDTYVVDDGGDQIVEQEDEGIDTVLATVSHTLGTNVENLTLSSQFWAMGNGNALDNVLHIGDAGGVLSGLDGDDRLYGAAGADVLDGGPGADRLFGGVGVDTLVGGAGNDRLKGGDDGDDYVINQGDGFDTVIENDSTPGVVDVLWFGAGIGADQLWFRQVGQNLDVSIIGTNDGVRVQNWFRGESYRVEMFELADGQILRGADVQSLVDAMKPYALADDGQTVLPAAYVATLQGVIDLVWM